MKVKSKKKTPVRKGASAGKAKVAKAKKTSKKTAGKPRAQKLTPAQDRAYKMGYKSGFAAGKRKALKTLLDAGSSPDNVVEIKKEAVA